jgi:hypothetical protein
VDLKEWSRWWKDVGSDQMRLLVMDVWDPIGVRGEPAAINEYDSYLVRIVGGLRQGYSIDAIASELAEYRTRNMGLPPAPERDRAAATAIADWYSEATSERLPSGDIPER